MVQKLGITKKIIKVGEISVKYDILTVEEKRIVFIGNKKNNPWNDSKTKRDRGGKAEGGQYAD